MQYLIIVILVFAFLLCCYVYLARKKCKQRDKVYYCFPAKPVIKEDPTVPLCILRNDGVCCIRAADSPPLSGIKSNQDGNVPL